MLNTFHKISLILASVLLIIALIITGVLIYNSLMEKAFPPIISDCPDYWNVHRDENNNIICRNLSTVNRGSPKCQDYPVTGFSQNGTSEHDLICEKQRWAESCGIYWDGVTNNKTACNNTTIQGAV